jgi:hypothetical protein
LFAGDDVLGDGLGGHSEKTPMRKAVCTGLALALVATAVVPAMAGSYGSYSNYSGSTNNHRSEYGKDYGSRDKDYGRYSSYRGDDKDYGRYGKGSDRDYGHRDSDKNYGRVRVAE